MMLRKSVMLCLFNLWALGRATFMCTADDHVAVAEVEAVEAE